MRFNFFYFLPGILFSFSLGVLFYYIFLLDDSYRHIPSRHVDVRNGTNYPLIVACKDFQEYGIEVKPNSRIVLEDVKCERWPLFPAQK